VGYVLALASAALYGAADFLGGLASRSVSTVATVVVSQAAGLVLLLVLIPFLPAAATLNDLIWGGAAGLAGGIGVGLLYRALAIGTMAIVAPTTAVCAVLIPVAAETIAGARLGGRTIAGILLALVAIVLVSQQPLQPLHVERTLSGSLGAPDKARPTMMISRALGLALLSGVAIGFFFLALARTDAAAGLWPLVAARAVSVSLFLALAVAGRQSLRMPARPLTVVMGCGVLDMAANALYILATRRGALSAVVALASLYPASTVLLARVVLGERLSGRQAVGIVSALVAVVLIVST
jgi:drug/metabolite transporter (DMT)-like permease